MCCYETTLTLEEDKLMILNRVDSLLDEFVSISKGQQMDQANQGKKDDFTEFFEQ